MVRVSNGAALRQKKNRRLKQAKGYWGGRSKLWRTATETLLRAWAFSTRDRRQKKREFRALWIVRVSAAARMRGMTYSAFIDGVHKANIQLNRKQLAEIAIHDAAAFDRICEEAKAARA
ncbi:MAG: 50S ribosomal protein L20 [Planctomycetes bacterium]|nr:50S ribosomal protein L20 [Planctomycetota bacterium]